MSAETPPRGDAVPDMGKWRVLAETTGFPETGYSGRKALDVLSALLTLAGQVLADAVSLAGPELGRRNPRRKSIVG